MKERTYYYTDGRGNMLVVHAGHYTAPVACFVNDNNSGAIDTKTIYHLNSLSLDAFARLEDDNREYAANYSELAAEETMRLLDKVIACMGYTETVAK